MRRTQLYLEEDLWSVLHAKALDSQSTVSQVVRDALRERYVGKFEDRRKAMQAFIGIRKDRPEFRDTEAYVRKLRRGTRLERLHRD